MKLVLKEKQVEEVKTYSDMVTKPNQVNNMVSDKLDELKSITVSLNDAQEYLRTIGREKSALKLGELSASSDNVTLADVLYFSGMLEPGKYNTYQGK